MGIKEILTYVLFIIGLIMVCISKVKFTARQKITPDNAYSKAEKTMLHCGYAVLAIAFILACIPIY